MEISRAQIVVACVHYMMVVVVIMRILVTMMVMTVMMAMIILQEPRASQIDNEADDGNGNSLFETDRHGVGDPQEALPSDQKGDERQYDSAGKTGQITKLTGAKGEARITRMAARIDVSKRSNQHRAGMGGHMPTIGDQRHRAIE